MGRPGRRRSNSAVKSRLPGVGVTKPITARSICGCARNSASPSSGGFGAEDRESPARERFTYQFGKEDWILDDQDG